ncbi:UNVERIFIED_CONTAM: hypothetical protein K2H54_065779 [Gekko kuhli]
MSFLLLLRKIEAKEACDWLRAAGFPQYAQLYEDSQFPIDIAAVKKDHDFLDKDLVEPLCRLLLVARHWPAALAAAEVELTIEHIEQMRLNETRCEFPKEKGKYI